MDDIKFIKEEGKGVVNGIKNVMNAREKCGVNTKEFTLKMSKITIQKLLKYIEVLEFESQFSMAVKNE